MSGLKIDPMYCDRFSGDSHTVTLIFFKPPHGDILGLPSQGLQQLQGLYLPRAWHRTVLWQPQYFIGTGLWGYSQTQVAFLVIEVHIPRSILAEVLIVFWRDGFGHHFMQVDPRPQGPRIS